MRRRGVLPRKINEALQGRIMQELLCTVFSTKQLAEQLQEPLTNVRCEVRSLHYQGIVDPIGERVEEGGTRPPFFYFRDLIWELTEHAREHYDITPGCRACTWREKELIAMALASGRPY